MHNPPIAYPHIRTNLKLDVDQAEHVQKPDGSLPPYAMCASAMDSDIVVRVGGSRVV